MAPGHSVAGLRCDGGVEQTVTVHNTSGNASSLFPSEPGIPRRRRLSDVVRLILAACLFILLGWVAAGGPETDTLLAELPAELPSWIRSLAWVGFAGSALGALALVAAALVSLSERRLVVRDLLSALGVAVAVAVLAGQLATGTWPFLLPEFIDQPERLPFPTLRTTWVVVVVFVLGPYVSAGVQRLTRWMVVAVAVAPLLLGVSTLSAVFGALALGFLSVAAVRLAFGSPEGLPSLKRVADELSRTGLQVEGVAYRDDQPGTVGLATATAQDGRTLDVKIYGADAASRQRAERVWRTLWYRRAGPSPRAGRSEQAAHEALAVLSARTAGIEVPALAGAGQVPNGDVIVVSDAPSGMALDEIPDPTDAQLVALWTELLRLHRQGRITHGSVAPDTLRLDGEQAQLVDLASASLMPTEQQRATDVVSMLASQAVVVGSDRAVDAALAALEPAELQAALPYAQDAVLAPALRRVLRASGAGMKDLAGRIAERLEVEVPEPASVRRVSWRDLFIAVAAIVAANALISQIADVGFGTLLSELADASVGSLLVAFALSLCAYGTAYFALNAVVDQPLPFLPVTFLQAAKSFVGLVVPSMVGRVGLDIRFLQLAGVPVVVASTQGPVIGFFGLVAEVVLLALGAWAIGQEIETDSLGEVDGGGLVALAVAVVVIGLVVVFAVPKLRRAILPVIREALGSVRSIITSPGIVATIFTSELADRLIKALALGATVAAFGAELPFAALVFVSVGTGLLAGLSPVPGGIGVAEATMAGLLTAAGLPAEQSVSIAIVHRLVTSYLPPVLGFFSFNWLNEKGYL